MSSRNFSNLKEQFQTKFQFNVNARAEALIGDISRSDGEERTYSGIARRYPRFSSEIFRDNIRSLILSRSIDMVVTRKEALNNIDGLLLQTTYEGDINTITPSDVIHSVFTLPCICPIVCECCPRLGSGDLQYLTVYPRDTEFLRAMGVNTIGDLIYVRSDINFEDVSKTWRGTLRNEAEIENESYLSYLSKTTQKKLELWKYTSSNIVVPLINIFR
jgi:hypothetical protein